MTTDEDRRPMHISALSVMVNCRAAQNRISMTPQADDATEAVVLN